MAERAKQVLLAEKWEPDKDPTGYWISEKLDGVRAYWNGSNFYSRLGNIFPAPQWFKDRMPKAVLDGELWCGRKQFQRCVSIVKNTAKSEEWKYVQYLVFDAPEQGGKFEDRQAFLETVKPPKGADAVHRVIKHQKCKGLTDLNTILAQVEKMGGEGLMLRQPGSLYEWCRSSTLLKVKTFHDEEAIVVAHQAGQGRNSHRMGALEVQTPDGRIFHVGTGFTDKQRDRPPKIGTIITYRYQELSNSLKPRFPSFVGERMDLDWEEYKKNYRKPELNALPALKRSNTVLFTSITPSLDDDAAGSVAGKKHGRDDDDGSVSSAAGTSAAAGGGGGGGKKKPMCKYGTACYRKNPQHLADFDHPPPPGAAAALSSSSSSAGTGGGGAAEKAKDDDTVSHKKQRELALAADTDEESVRSASPPPSIDVVLQWASGSAPDGADGEKLVLPEGLTVIGRGTMGMLDTAVSRRQLEFRVSHDPLFVSVKLVGRNMSQIKRAGDVDFVDLDHDGEVEVNDGDEVSLLVAKASRIIVNIG